jgi:hypothetical protein
MTISPETLDAELKTELANILELAGHLTVLDKQIGWEQKSTGSASTEHCY